MWPALDNAKSLIVKAAQNNTFALLLLRDFVLSEAGDDVG